MKTTDSAEAVIWSSGARTSRITTRVLLALLNVPMALGGISLIDFSVNGWPFVGHLLGAFVCLLPAFIWGAMLYSVYDTSAVLLGTGIRLTVHKVIGDDLVIDIPIRDLEEVIWYECPDDTNGGTMNGLALRIANLGLFSTLYFTEDEALRLSIALGKTLTRSTVDMGASVDRARVQFIESVLRTNQSRPLRSLS